MASDSDGRSSAAILRSIREKLVEYKESLLRQLVDEREEALAASNEQDGQEDGNNSVTEQEAAPTGDRRQEQAHTQVEVEAPNPADYSGVAAVESPVESAATTDEPVEKVPSAQTTAVEIILKKRRLEVESAAVQAEKDGVPVKRAKRSRAKSQEQPLESAESSKHRDAKDEKLTRALESTEEMEDLPQGAPYRVVRTPMPPNNNGVTGVKRPAALPRRSSVSVDSTNTEFERRLRETVRLHHFSQERNWKRVMQYRLAADVIVAQNAESVRQEQENRQMARASAEVESKSDGKGRRKADAVLASAKSQMTYIVSAALRWMLDLYSSGLNIFLNDQLGMGKAATIVAFLSLIEIVSSQKQHPQLNPQEGPHLIIVSEEELHKWREQRQREWKIKPRTHGYKNEDDFLIAPPNDDDDEQLDGDERAEPFSFGSSSDESCATVNRLRIGIALHYDCMQQLQVERASVADVMQLYGKSSSASSQQEDTSHLRRVRSEVEPELGKIEEISLSCQPSFSQKTQYRNALSGFAATLDTAGGREERLSVWLQLLLRLREICNCVDIVNDLDKLGHADLRILTSSSAKLEALEPLLRRLAIQEGKKVVIYCQFTAMFPILELFLSLLDIGFVRVTGSIAMQRRALCHFADRPVVRVALVSTRLSTLNGRRAASVFGGEVIVVVDGDWNAACDAKLRASWAKMAVGGADTLPVYRLHCENTVEASLLRVGASLTEKVFGEMTPQELLAVPSDLASSLTIEKPSWWSSTATSSGGNGLTGSGTTAKLAIVAQQVEKDAKYCGDTSELEMPLIVHNVDLDAEEHLLLANTDELTPVEWYAVNYVHGVTDNKQQQGGGKAVERDQRSFEMLAAAETNRQWQNGDAAAQLFYNLESRHSGGLEENALEKLFMQMRAASAGVKRKLESQLAGIKSGSQKEQRVDLEGIPVPDISEFADDDFWGDTNLDALDSAEWDDPALLGRILGVGTASTGAGTSTAIGADSAGSAGAHKEAGHSKTGSQKSSKKSKTGTGRARKSSMSADSGRDAWSVHDDIVLKKLFELYGANWTLIAQVFNSATAVSRTAAAAKDAKSSALKAQRAAAAASVAAAQLSPTVLDARIGLPQSELLLQFPQRHSLPGLPPPSIVSVPSLVEMTLAHRKKQATADAAATTVSPVAAAKAMPVVVPPPHKSHTDMISLLPAAALGPDEVIKRSKEAAVVAVQAAAAVASVGRDGSPLSASGDVMLGAGSGFGATCDGRVGSINRRRCCGWCTIVGRTTADFTSCDDSSVGRKPGVRNAGVPLDLSGAASGSESQRNAPMPVTTSTLLHVLDRMPEIKNKIQSILNRTDCSESQKVAMIARLLSNTNAINNTNALGGAVLSALTVDPGMLSSSDMLIDTETPIPMPASLATPSPPNVATSSQRPFQPPASSQP
uniref:Myb-like domain-containing protein n=1 Tax=Phytophthora ramorum TaxID=164328 RepID=H3HDT6_PHYRM